MVIVQSHSLTKRYRSVTALDDCSFEVQTGEVFGLLGPNGAGKTTLIRLLLGFLNPTSGSAQVDGFDCHRQSVEVRRRTSYLPAEPRMFRRMRARDVLQFFASIRGATGDFELALRLAGRLDLDTNRRVALMSTGMRQKLALVASLSHDAQLLILDEPTANLDPNVRRDVISIVRELRADGKTILLSSHVLTEIEEICDRVVILRDGRLVHTQVMSELQQKYRVSGRNPSSPADVPTELADRVTVDRHGDVLHIESDGDLGDVLPWIAHLALRDVKIEPSGLRSVYENFHVPEETT